MRYGAYAKTWTGRSTGSPPLGGGGGLGHASNITSGSATPAASSAGRSAPAYNSVAGGCETSRFALRDVRLRCSGARPCAGWVVEGVDIVDPVNGTRPARYLCDNVVDPIGFSCTGAPWGENNR